MKLLDRLPIRSLPRLTVRTATIGCLVLASLASLGAWQLQSRAADALVEAYEIQQRKVPESDSAPPSPEENLAIVDRLTESIRIRREIDGLLAQIEADVAYLQDRQSESAEVTTLARSELDHIGGSLGGAVAAARSSVRRLGGLGTALDRSAGLARAIAEELEELDRKLGPSAGGGPR